MFSDTVMELQKYIKELSILIFFYIPTNESFLTKYEY